MIPLKLHLSGFLSYQNPVDLDFSGFELACISGFNGAGKSSLLDAITWVLFGEARCRDDEALINSHVNSAEVLFEFGYENNAYRVQRSKPRGKTTLLEFYICTPEGNWRSMTEKSVRDTENRIRQTLRMDYDTFTNASFFLQGHADQFAQQQPANRKKVLSSVLGLEVWETYRAQAFDQRRLVENELKLVDGQIAEINSELAQEGERKTRLAEVEQRLEQASALRLAKESNLTTLQRLAQSLDEQKKLLDLMKSRVGEIRSRVSRLREELEQRASERDQLRERIQSAAAVEEAYQRWQVAREELARWDQTAASFHEIQARRSEPQSEISAHQSRLDEERRSLSVKAATMRQEEERLASIKHDLPDVSDAIKTVQARLGQRTHYQDELVAQQQRLADVDAENRRLKTEMSTLKERIEQLKDVEGAVCPVCGQPLSPEDRAAMIAGLEADGKRMGDTYRLNQAAQKECEVKTREVNASLAGLTRYEDELRTHTRRYDQLEAEAARLNESAAGWLSDGAVRLAELERVLSSADFAHEARQRLAVIDKEARQLGYDAAAHDEARRMELSGRASEGAMRELAEARASLEPVERQVSGLEAQVQQESALLDGQEKEVALAESKYQADSTNLPDLNQIEKEVLDLRAEENRLRMDTGMIRQLVAVLDTQRERKVRLSARREELAKNINQLKVLERAFSKDGVPALLIEQALPEIETQANELLDRLSMGAMSVRFATQRQLKSKDEKRETLDILISDSAGVREYEMFSGGEAFRVNFAIRLALSRVLAHRAGARLQTLFIDEGFGSQDAEGRQRLIEAINLVRPEFARILVITHLEELKEAFPARIEVEKTPQGSQLRVVT